MVLRIDAGRQRPLPRTSRSALAAAPAARRAPGRRRACGAARARGSGSVAASKATHGSAGTALLATHATPSLRQDGGMRILVTGARGKVGRATVAACTEAGHDVTATDVSPPTFERPGARRPAYVQADLTDAGDAYAVVARPRRRHPRRRHPRAARNPPHTVFRNNLMATFNVIEAAVRFGVPRFVNVSSETVPGFFFPERAVPARLRADRRGAPDPPAGPLRAREGLRRAADGRGGPPLGHPLHLDPPVAGCSGRATTRATSARSCATPTGERGLLELHRRLRPRRRAAPGRRVRPARATRSSTSPRPTTRAAGRWPSSSRRHHGDEVELRELDRPGRLGHLDREGARACSATSPKRSWRDYLDADGRLRPEGATAPRPAERRGCSADAPRGGRPSGRTAARSLPGV